MSSASSFGTEDGRRDRFGRMLDRSLGLLAATFLAVLALLTLGDVIGRYVLNAPITGAFEIVEILMAALIFSALPAVTFHDKHITIDLLDGVTPAWLVIWRNVVIHAISTVVLFGITVRLWEIALVRRDYGDITAFLNIPLFPVALAMCALSGITTLVCLALIWFELTARDGARRPAP